MRVVLAHLAVSVAALLAHAGGLPFFGFYDANLTATPYATTYQANSVADASAAFGAFGVPSLLSVYDAVFVREATRLVLQPQWQQQLAALVASAAPLRASGAVMGFNLGDELVWNCLAPSNLTLVANAARALCPRGACTLWYNEAAVFGRPGPFKDSCGNVVADFAIPPALDWFSADIYHMDGPVAGWVDTKVRSFYDAWIFPNITAQQRVVLVPGSFGSTVNHYPNGTYVCDQACYDAMCALDAADFAAWAAADSRVIGVFPWNWGGCPSCNGSRWTPPHECCMDELGTDVQPKTVAAWKALYGGGAVGVSTAP